MQYFASKPSTVISQTDYVNQPIVIFDSILVLLNKMIGHYRSIILKEMKSLFHINEDQLSADVPQLSLSFWVNITSTSKGGSWFIDEFDMFSGAARQCSFRR